jgi:hypothetical protein
MSLITKLFGTYSDHQIKKIRPTLIQINDLAEQYRRLSFAGCGGRTPRDTAEALRNLQLVFAHAVYLEAIEFQMASGVGSRGSAMVMDPVHGQDIHPALGEEWRYMPENEDFRNQQLVTRAESGSRWIPCRPIPEADDWFENVWADFRSKKIYQ